MQALRVRIVGASPVIFHNSRLANPLDPIVKRIKEITGRRKKTDEDLEAIFLLEWEGGLYYDDEAGPYIPGMNLEAAIKGAGKLRKRGMDVLRGLQVSDAIVPLQYKGPRKLEKLREQKAFFDVRIVSINRSKTPRCRPIFHAWSAEFTVLFDEEVFNQADVLTILNDAGQYIGLGEMHPRYGKFVVEVIGQEAKAS